MTPQQPKPILTQGKSRKRIRNVDETEDVIPTKMYRPTEFPQLNLKECTTEPCEPTSYKYMCDICYRVFQQLSHLKHHRLTQHWKDTLEGNNDPVTYPLICKYCGKKYLMRQPYENHMRTHHSTSNVEKTHPQPTAITHPIQETTTNDRPGVFKCKMCKRIFTRRKFFEKHILTHMITHQKGSGYKRWLV
jgi:uncharacterized C2H2 Zn-finger protein